MSRQAHERELHRWTSVRLKPHGHGSANPTLEEAVHVEFGMPGRVARSLPPTNEVLNRTGAHSITGPRQRPRTAALSGSNPKAPGSAGGYLPSCSHPVQFEKSKDHADTFPKIWAGIDHNQSLR
jgi:hypothetical protein